MPEESVASLNLFESVAVPQKSFPFFSNAPPKPEVLVGGAAVEDGPLGGAVVEGGTVVGGGALLDGRH